MDHGKLTWSLSSSSLRVWEQVKSSMGKLYHNQTIRWSNYSWKVVWLSRELISTLKNHIQVIVILLMQNGTTFAWINQPLWHHYDAIWKWCHPVLYSHCVMKWPPFSFLYFTLLSLTLFLPCDCHVITLWLIVLVMAIVPSCLLFCDLLSRVTLLSLWQLLFLWLYCSLLL